MTQEEFEFLEKVSLFVMSKPSMLESVIKAATKGMELALTQAKDDLRDMEVILMHQVTKSKIPGMKEITYPMIASKIREMENRQTLSFSWSHVIEEMRHIK